MKQMISQVLSNDIIQLRQNFLNLMRLLKDEFDELATFIHQLIDSLIFKDLCSLKKTQHFKQFTRANLCQIQ